MATARKSVTEHIQYHKDGTVWAKGPMAGGVATGYWEWLRKDGTKLRSGHFDNGRQVGEWITYDKAGQPYKVTRMKTTKPAARKPSAARKRSAPRT